MNGAAQREPLCEGPPESKPPTIDVNGAAQREPGDDFEVIDNESREDPGGPPFEVEGHAMDASPRHDGARQARVIPHVDVHAIFAPLPPIEWVCEPLRLAPSSGVTLLAGYGFSGKTVAVQSLALSVASGHSVFGVFACKQGRVLHLDYEQGARLTYERYQRLARGMGITTSDLGDRLCLATFPNVYLDDPDAPDVFARALDPFDIVIVDALRGAAPTVEENSSDVRRVLDLLARASERTGAVPLVLAHARKDAQVRGGGASQRDAKQSIRGSGAIYDACGNVFVLGGAKGEPVRVTHEKDRLRGTLLDDFGLGIQDVEIGGDPQAGLRVVHLNAEQLAKRSAGGGGGAPAKHADRITAWLAALGSTFAGNKGALQVAIGMNRTDFFKAFSTLEALGRVAVLGPSKKDGRTGTRISLIPEVNP